MQQSHSQETLPEDALLRGALYPFVFFCLQIISKVVANCSI